MNVAARTIVLVACLAAVGPARAHQHLAPCNGTVTTVATPAGTFYVDDRHRAPIDHYIYMESNGHAGLQTGGRSATSDLYPQNDPCHNHNCIAGNGCPAVQPDTFVF